MQQERTNKEFIVLLAGSIAFVLLSAFAVTCLSGCTTAHKFTKYGDRHKAVSAPYCALRYPCQDSTTEIIKYLQGETVIVNHDSVVERTDTVTNVVTRTEYKTKYVTKVDTLYKERIIKQTDKALVYSLQANFKQAEQQRDNNLASLKKWKGRAMWGFGSLFLLVLLVAWYVWRKIKKGWK